jgi:hypothetical protein
MTAAREDISRRAAWALAGLAILVACLPGPGLAEAKKKPPPALDRPTDPVVMTGADLPRLLGISPDALAAYRFQPAKHGKKAKQRAAVAKGRDRIRSGRWIRVPVQVDERAVVDFGMTPTGSPPSGDHTVYGTPPVGSTALQYTDPGTFVGPDPNPTLDGNDEVAFMASDAGLRAGARVKRPRHTARGGATRVQIEDPLTQAKRWIYLFRGTTGLPSLPTDYVSYNFQLLSGDYKQTYKRDAGPNPEASTIHTHGYTVGFSDRWFFDRLQISAGGASGADILDGYKFAFAPGSCGRSEATFNAGEGAFVVNKDGPVRAIRSYVGANSGPYTERTDLFYADRHDIVTDLRVHPIPGLFTQYDLSPAAIGMTYYDEQNQGGAPVDGVPETLPSSAPSQWHLWTGPQGSLLAADQIDSSFSAAFLAGATAFYMDDSTPAVSQCWGDSQQIGAAGLSSAPAGGIPATYPGAADHLQAVSTDLMLAPHEVPSRAVLLHQALLHHLLARAGVFRRPAPRR